MNLETVIVDMTKKLEGKCTFCFNCRNVVTSIYQKTEKNFDIKCLECFKNEYKNVKIISRIGIYGIDFI